MNEERIRIESSEDMRGLNPQTDHEYLMIMFESQKTVLKRQEEFSGFRQECEKTFRDLGSRIGKVEGATIGIIGSLALAVGVWALERMLGG